MVRTIYLLAVQPIELVGPIEQLNESFRSIKIEKEGELIFFYQQGFDVYIEVQYPKRLPQIFKCVYPAEGEVNWNTCEFNDETQPY
jgi:hypothetical protein